MPNTPLTETNKTEFLDTNLKLGFTYYYKIISKSTDKLSQPSSIISSTPNTTPSKILIFGAKTGEDSQVTLKWEEPQWGNPIIGYKIFKSTSSNVPTNTEPYVSVSHTASEYIDTNVSNGTTYYYKILAYNSLGNGQPSYEIFAKPIASSYESSDYLFVDSNYDSEEKGSKAKPYKTISAAISAADDNGIIVILDGTYNLSTSLSKPLTIRSEYNHYALSNVIINPNTDNKVFVLNNGINGVNIEGLNLKGIIWMAHSSSGSNINIRFNNMDVGAMAIDLVSNTQTRQNYKIIGNKIKTTSASAMTVFGLYDSDILDNEIVSTNYGGILCDKAININIKDNIIQNTPEQGIQIAGDANNVIVENNFIEKANLNNTADKGCIRLYGSGFSGTVNIKNNILKNCYNGIAIRSGQNIKDKNIIIENNVILENSNLGVYYNNYNNSDTYGTLNVTHNYWNHPLGPKHLNNPDGNGEKLEDSVTFIPFKNRP